MLPRKLLAICLSLSVCFGVLTTHADTNSDLQHFFNGLGFSGNATKTQSYQTQAAGFVSMGGMYERTQVRDLQIIHADAPSIRSGCGGIDIFAGGFSFIKASQITQFMQNILSSGAGYALNLALETELPEVAHALQYMQTLANKMNQQNFNSCNMAEDLVGGLWPKSRQASQQICQDLGTQDNIFSDWADAQQHCGADGQSNDMLDKAKKDPNYKDRVLYKTNVVWDAIQNQAFLASDERLAELYMSISGTVVFDDKGMPQTYPSLIVNRNFIKALLYGGELPSYICRDTGGTGKCLNIDASQSAKQTISPSDGLVSQVETVLNAIYQNIVDDTPLTEQQINVINMTHQSPVFSMLIADAENRTGVANIHVLAQMLATDLLTQYLNEAVNIIRGSLAGKQLGGGNEQRVYKSLEIVRQEIEGIANANRAQFNQVLETNTAVQKIQAQAVHGLSSLLRQGYEESK